MIYSKNDKIELINKILIYFDKISYITGLSKKSIAHIIRAFHFSSPLFILFIIYYCPLYLVIISIIFLIIIYTFFLLFNGCILSRIESEILNDSFCITDPALEIFRFQITNKNRYNISYIIGIIYLLLVFLIIYKRYLYNLKFP